MPGNPLDDSAIYGVGNNAAERHDDRNRRARQATADAYERAKAEGRIRRAVGTLQEARARRAACDDLLDDMERDAFIRSFAAR